MIQLGKEQLKALEKIKTFITDSEDTSFSLTGVAGSGKSTVVGYLIQWLNGKINYCLVAPTHKAALVMERYSGIKARTLHSLLALSPNIEIFELDFRELDFKTGESTEIPRNGVVICDEASMINDDLFDLLEDRCEERHTKIIYISDKCQLVPVKSKDYSKVYTTKHKFNLTKIYRQSKDNAILPILQELRIKAKDRFDTLIGKEGSLYVDKYAKVFVQNALDAFSSAIRKRDILATKILAYTNSRVRGFNQTIHKHLFDDEYNQNEFLTCYENLEFDDMKFYNSMDYIIVNNPIKTDVYIPNFGILPGYTLSLYDDLTKEIGDINIISSIVTDDYFDALAATIERLRIAAIKGNNSRNRGKLWAEYFKTYNSFTSPRDLLYENRVVRKKSFDYGYAVSVHRSQGSSYNSVFVDIDNINLCKEKMVRRQLQYVALSRTRGDCYILQK